MSVTITPATLLEPTWSVVGRTEDGRDRKYLYLPDTMAKWPWPRKINPYYEEVAAESNAWLRCFTLFTPESQYAYETCDFGRIASLAYPDVSRGSWASSVSISWQAE